MIQQPKPNCALHASYSEERKRCVCDINYSSSLNGSRCVKIPSNAHQVNSLIDVWQCNKGYREVGEGCRKEVGKTRNKEVLAGGQGQALAGKPQVANNNPSEDDSSGSMENFLAWSLSVITVGSVAYALGSKRRI